LGRRRGEVIALVGGEKGKGREKGGLREDSTSERYLGGEKKKGNRRKKKKKKRGGGTSTHPDRILWERRREKKNRGLCPKLGEKGREGKRL